MITTPILVMSGVLVVFIVAVLIVGVAALAAMIAVALCVAVVRIVQFSRRVSGFGPKNASGDGFRGVSFAVHPLTAALTKAPAWLKQKTHGGIK